MTFGRILRRVQVADVEVIETIHPPGLRLPRHDHGHASLNITVGGGYDEVFDRHTVTSRPDTVVMKPAGEFHANKYGTGVTRFVMVDFSPRFATRVGRQHTNRLFGEHDGDHRHQRKHRGAELRLPELVREDAVEPYRIADHKPRLDLDQQRAQAGHERGRIAGR